MKLNGKALKLLLSAGIIFLLSGCGSGGTSTTDSGNTTLPITTDPVIDDNITITPPVIDDNTTITPPDIDDNTTDDNTTDDNTTIIPPDIDDNTTVDTTPQPGELGYQTILPDGSIEYVDYTGKTRIAPPSAAAAEYHTGVNFGNTLFDSAEKKCQNCHNELYDTWKNSMHGKSWSEPIFQANMQDFLRLELAKIGSTGPSSATSTGILYEQKEVGVGTKNMFTGSAQTCIKCHAPGAYYAGDVKIKVTEVKSAIGVTSEELATLKSTLEKSDPSGEIAVIASSDSTDKIYKATFQIGHQANREGINCAFCHSIETPRLMKADGMDNGKYTLAQDMRNGVHGSIVRYAGTDLLYNTSATSADMNAYFKLVGPEKYTAYHATPKENFDIAKTADGRFTMTSKDLNGTNGKVHFTGGPFYGPYGVTGTSNENETDQTDRVAQVNPHFDKDDNNHFGESGKGLCLSCHQRSGGGLTPKGEEGAGKFMELCTTQNAVTTGDDTASNDSLSSPKCQKCHMERIEGTVLHKWARPDLKWTLTDNDHLTPEFNPDDETVASGENPVRDGWLNSHAFLGASKVGHDAASATAKIKSGFEGSISTRVNGNILTVTTTFANKTAHMFPGAHPMRRVLSRVIVTDSNGDKIDMIGSTGASTFADIENAVQPLQGKVLHESTSAPVLVNDNGSALLSFPGKVPDLNGGAVVSQKFDGTAVIISGTDSALIGQTITDGLTTGTVNNAAITVSTVASNFTRIYGHETGKKFDLDKNASTPAVFVVRPGFDSNMIASDARLSPNETETYTLTYNIAGKSGVNATYKIYYMQKGANGKFPTTPEGWLDKAANAEKKLLITEVGTYTEDAN